MLYSPSFITMALANLSTVCSIGAFFLFPLFITSHGGSKAAIGVIMGIASLTSALCRPWIAEMIDRISLKRSYTIGSLILGVLVYLLFRGDLPRFKRALEGRPADGEAYPHIDNPANFVIERVVLK
jgi:hypothetical protein